jgi:antirestriction protein ArdC
MSAPAPRLPLAVRQVLWQRIWDRLLQPLPGEVASWQQPHDPSLAAVRTSMPEEGSS